MLELKQLSKNYGDHVIFKDLNYQFMPGKSYALVGASGSGKSTLLNMIARFEKPSDGEILFDEANIWQMKEKAYFKSILGYIFQNYALMDNETVGTNLAVVDKKVSNQRLALKHVGLPQEAIDQKIYELSGGQGQRVAIARLLLKEAKLILADEPTGALDQATGKAIIDMLLAFSDPEHIVIFATHDPNVYERVDVVLDMNDLLK